jgi:methionyl-tRNA formyltransferase
MRVVFLGNAPWSVPSLEAVAGSSHDAALVLTRVPRPAGRGMRLTPTPVADTARRLELPLLEVGTVRSGMGFDALVEASPDVLAVVAYGEILPQAVLDVPSVAPVNVHFSLLPKLRGAAPVQRAILEGLESTGVTTIRMDAGMDTGPILLEASEPIRSGDDAGGLGDRLSIVGGRLLVQTLDGLAAGTIVERAQDDSQATTAPKLTTMDQQIKWDRLGVDIERQVRALAPDPGAVTLHRGRAVKVFKVLTARRAPAAPNEPVDGEGPGTVIAVGNRGPVIASADDWALVLEEVQPEGKRRMTGAEFVRGYRPVPGERLG